MRIAALVVLLLVGPCAAPEPEPFAAGLLTVEGMAAQEAACTKRGGAFTPIKAGSTVNICVVTPKDANQACTSNADCTGVCLARSRTCAPVVPLRGCHEVLLPGGQSALQCIE